MYNVASSAYYFLWVMFDNILDWPKNAKFYTKSVNVYNYSFIVHLKHDILCLVYPRLVIITHNVASRANSL